MARCRVWPLVSGATARCDTSTTQSLCMSMHEIMIVKRDDGIDGVQDVVGIHANAV